MSIFTKHVRRFDPNKDNEDLKSKKDSRKVQKDKILKRGLNGDHQPEATPNFISAKGDLVQKGIGNSWIVHTRDRPGSRASGHGGSGETDSSTIDLCVGRKGNSDHYVDPNFKTDAARIYISQKTDIDTNFNLVDGSFQSTDASGIGIKADAIRIIARENIKIVTGPFPRESSSNEGFKWSSQGIDLIANNEDANLQPIPLGDNLLEALEVLADAIVGVSAMLDTLQASQLSLENTIKSHTHALSLGNLGIPLTLNADVPLLKHAGLKAIKQANNVSLPMFDHRYNIENFRRDYLSLEGPKFICSTRNRVN